MNFTNKAHYDDCRVMTMAGQGRDRDCDCGVSYDNLNKLYATLEEKYFNLTLKYNNLSKGPICGSSASPGHDFELDYGSD